MCGALDALRDGKVDEARARLCLAIAQTEQESLDHGNATLSQELSFEPAPPFATFSTHVLPESTEMPYTRLLPGRWVEACAHRLKEVDSYLEMRKKLGQKPKQPAPPSPIAQTSGKGKGKQGGKKKGGDTKSAEAEQKEG